MQITIKPFLKQHICYEMLKDPVSRFILFGGGAGGGKSWLGAEWLIQMCYLYPGSKWFVGRKELKRLMSSSYVTFQKVCLHHKIPRGDWKLNGQYNFIQFINGSRIDLLDLDFKPSDPDFERFGSLEYTGGWIEEAEEVQFKCFDVLKTRVGRHMNNEYGLSPAKILLTCNPTQNWLYRVFYKPHKENRLADGYVFIKSLYKDNPVTKDTYELQLNEIDDPTLRARLRDGLWEYNSDDFLMINYEAILDLFTNTIPESDKVYFTADIARFGSDKIVYAKWRGYNVYNLEQRTKQSTLTTEEDIKDMLVKSRIPFSNSIVDEDGIGGGIVDHIVGINGFVGNRSPVAKEEKEFKDKYANVAPAYLTKQNYRNLRSQCYFMLADKINKREMCISAQLSDLQREQLVEELQQIRREDTAPDAPLQVVGKDMIKDAIGRSPDFSDTLMMRMYFDIAKPINRTYNPVNPEKLIGTKAVSVYGGVGWGM